VQSVISRPRWAIAALAAALLVAGTVSTRTHAAPSPEATAPSAPPAAPAAGAPAAGAPAAGAPAAGAPGEAQAIPFASAHAAAVTTPSTPSAWGGARTGAEPTLSDRVARYEIAAALDPTAHTIDATERLTWKNRSDRPVSAVYVHLYLNAFEGPGSTFMTEQRELGFEFRSAAKIKEGEWGHIDLKTVTQNGAPVPWTFVHPDGGRESDHTVARLDLATPIPPGGSALLDIAFHDQLPRVIARTGWFGTFHLVGQWFPKVGVLELPGERGATAPRWNVHEFHLHSEFYADWAEYDVRMTVPRDFQVASTGEEQGPPVEKDGLVTHHFVQGDVHDFAWMAANDFAPPIEGSYDGPGSPHVTVRVFYPAEYEASARPALKATIDSLRYFSETLGPYPYKTSTCVVPPFNAGEAGGMEYQTFFTAEGYPTVEPDTLNSMLLDFVTIHEFGHGYFYGLLASNEFEEPLLDEGMNEYWDQRMLRERNERVVLTSPLLKAIGFAPSMSGFEFERAQGTLDPHPVDPIGANSWDRMSSRTYGTVYSRTAITMHDLEERIGKEVMERAMKLYYARWHFRHPSTADLRQAIVDTVDEPQKKMVESYFAQQVYAVSAIDDRIGRFTSEEDLPLPGTTSRDGTWVEETREAVDKQIEARRAEWKKTHSGGGDGDKESGPFPFRTLVVVRRDGAAVPQTVRVKFADGSVETETWDDDARWHRFTWVKPARAVSAEIDADRRWYMDDNKLDDSKTMQPDSSPARRWTADLTAIFEVIWSLLVAV
jgi:hypothetical protein